ncbi:hypothetical protein MLD38_030909 [Melastoma candidum]|uniref:Uncharacterized protein n=1 Tax=Melastoma candidum TaxID=119954 RepID=A0ACB9MN41_9MYRT|nr:hypothetical protein MLD38_030909 [Melastoma candidum]
MSKFSLLDMKCSFSKKPSLKLRKPARSTPMRSSTLPKIFEPNRDEMRRVFEKFDANKDGKVSVEEYQSAMEAIFGKGVSSVKDPEVTKAFRCIDKDGDGYIDFEEFLEVQKMGGGVTSCDIEGAFRAYDLDGNGKITAEELWEVMKRLGERCSLEACRNMVKGVDKNGDNMVDMDEFMTMMTRTMKLR